VGYLTTPFGVGDTNEIVIGYSTTGLGSNTVVIGNDDITLTRLKGKVGIGTSTPTYTLTVSGSIAGNGNISGSTITGGGLTAGSAAGISHLILNDSTGTHLGYDNAGTGMHVVLTGNNVQFQHDLADVMNLSGSYLGIGTTQPAYPLHVSGSLFATSGSIAGLNITNDGTKTTLLGNAGNYTRIGDAGTSSLMASPNEDDLLVTRQLEVKGVVFFGQTSYTATHMITTGWMGDSGEENKLNFFQNGHTSDHIFQVALSDNDKIMTITSKANYNKDHDHIAQVNPTLFIHSATNPDTNNTQWLSLTHDQTDGVITTGKGDLFLNPAGGEVKFGTYTSGAATDSTGYITIIDAGGTPRKLMVQA
jgi:hypothetical protein